jgi:hypothetical protein
MIYTNPRSSSFLIRTSAALFQFSLVAMAALITMVSTQVHADVSEWVLFKDHNYLQTSDNVRPTTVGLYDYEVFLVTDPGDFGTVNLLGPGVNIPLIEVEPGVWEEDEFFGTQAALDAVLPSSPTAYSISTTGGTLGILSESISLGPDRYPTLAPYVTGTSFSDMSSFDVNQDLIVNFGDPNSGDAQVTAFSFYVVDEFTDTDLFTYQEFGSAPFSGSFLIPGGTLDPLTTYTAEMEFSAFVSDVVDDFGPVSNSPISGTIFASLTTFEFTTSPVPEPGTFALAAIALLSVGYRRR